MPTTTITADNQVVTLINVFTVEPSQQQQLVELWQRATDEVLRHLPGFVSANVHRSLDGTKVVNYAQWESRQAFQAMLANPDARPWLEQLAQVGTQHPYCAKSSPPTTRPTDPSAYDMRCPASKTVPTAGRAQG